MHAQALLEYPILASIRIRAISYFEVSYDMYVFSVLYFKDLSKYNSNLPALASELVCWNSSVPRDSNLNI